MVPTSLKKIKPSTWKSPQQAVGGMQSLNTLPSLLSCGIAGDQRALVSILVFWLFGNPGTKAWYDGWRSWTEATIATCGCMVGLPQGHVLKQGSPPSVVTTRTKHTSICHRPMHHAVTLHSTIPPYRSNLKTPAVCLKWQCLNPLASPWIPL